jgi:hypothetical protein
MTKSSTSVTHPARGLPRVHGTPVTGPRENHDLLSWAGELDKMLTQLPGFGNPGPVSDAVSPLAPALTPALGSAPIHHRPIGE